MFKVSTIFDQFLTYILRGKNMGSFEKYGNNLRFFYISISHKASCTVSVLWGIFYSHRSLLVALSFSS